MLFPYHIITANSPVLQDTTSATFSVLKLDSTKNLEEKTFDYADNSLILLFKFYQMYITDIDGQTCPMHPTCSNFGLQSIKEYGFIIGSIKTIDRLHRCSHDLNYYKLIKTDYRTAYMDTP